MKRIVSFSTIIAAFIFALSFLHAPSPCFSADNDTILIQAFEITPDTLNLRSRGKFITAHMTLPEPYEDIIPPPDNITLHMLSDDNETGEVVALRTARNYYGELMVKFSRSEVQDLITENIDEFPAMVTLAIAIAVDNETLYGTDDIRVINPGHKGRGNHGGKGNDNSTGHGNGNGYGHDNDTWHNNGHGHDNDNSTRYGHGNKNGNGHGSGHGNGGGD